VIMRQLQLSSRNSPTGSRRDLPPEQFALFSDSYSMLPNRYKSKEKPMLNCDMIA
jgi:hypothetical protein